ncbi:NAD(P)/FAD-dependent oxidoreductase [Desulfobulbus alkaliphilus]|uniref:NAD(P)/FAD-dependent oxidoreductase n=1 Tax=Desulfobulbus alkaliphilus TaxID=869814 RepID=UPI0019664917|nr:NAD(P)/FAD-dependent oxidoreductase [Desulfobulbus alkaliphilus]MBM9535734.1 NAD(P)/FAD-dependent oxidoreductase [Desulfobulbus alkaliphilus]
MSKQMYDVVIIGSGPAGIQAAIHAVRRKTDVLMLGRIENSSLYWAHVENYAFIPGISEGMDLLRTGVEQAKSFGAEVSPEDVLKIVSENELFQLELESGRSITTRSLVFSMGVSKKKLGIPGEKDFIGRGVSYCVDCDANFYRGAVVTVTGDRSAAVDGALTLLDYAAKVYLVSAKLNVARELMERLKASKVECIESSVREVCGKNMVTSILLENGTRLESEGLFIELGSKGALELATQIGVQLDSESLQYIAVNRKQETNVAGIYAAGDIVGPPYQMAKAVGEGCIAGMEAASYARKMKKSEDLDS